MRSVITIAMLLLAALSGPAAGEEGGKGGGPPLDSIAYDGYLSFCSPCHGVSGRGDGHHSDELPGDPPRDFTQGLFQHRSTTGRIRSEDISRTIMKGLPGTEMPAFRRFLSEKEAEAIAQVVLHFSPRTRDEPAGEPYEVPPEPPDDEASRARGAEIYSENCAACHGEAGRGDGPRAASLESVWGHPVTPRNLVRGVYEGGGSPVDMYRTISVGMEGIPMPPYHFFLTPEEVWDVVHYTRSLQSDRGAWWRLFNGDPLDPTRDGEKPAPDRGGEEKAP